MPHYKDLANQLYWLDSESSAYLLPFGSIRITDEEADALRAQTPPPIAHEISPRQIRMALTQLGLRAQVEAAVAASAQDTKDWYQYSTFFSRQHPQVLAMADALGVSAQQLDALWALGANL